MKVAFGEELNRHDSGKHKFLGLLANSFRDKGIKVVNKNADILLHIGRNINKCKAKVKVFRLDGLWFNVRQNYDKKNKGILKNVNDSDGIIYQSVFCKEAYEKFLNLDKNKPNTIIFNGAVLETHKRQEKPDNFFIANCKWRPHKRLSQICESFKFAVANGLDSKLIVTGSPDYKISHPNIEYVGWKDTNWIKDHYTRAIASIHLAWLDWCPNSVVEALCLGCPVIYADSGGTPEIVGENGIKIEDDDWKYEAIDLYSPPMLSYGALSQAYKKLKEEPKSIVDPKVNIDLVSDSYIEFFKDLLNRK